MVPEATEAQFQVTHEFSIEFCSKWELWSVMSGGKDTYYVVLFDKIFDYLSGVLYLLCGE